MIVSIYIYIHIYTTLSFSVLQLLFVCYRFHNVYSLLFAACFFPYQTESYLEDPKPHNTFILLCCDTLPDKPRLEPNLWPAPLSNLMLPHSRDLTLTESCLGRLSYCTSVSEKWAGRLKRARTESSHQLFAAHDSPQKLCPMTSHTHTLTTSNAHTLVRLGQRRKRTHSFSSSDIQKWQSH